MRSCRTNKAKPSKLARHTKLGAAIALASCSSASFGLDYGIYDARAMAMGGTTVANASAQHAQFYNPALLALYDGDEEETDYGRFYFPMITVQMSDSVIDTADAIDDDDGAAVSDAVEVFNADPSEANAAVVRDTSTDLRNTIVDVGNQDLFVDLTTGLSVSEPSDRAGGAFYVGVRVLAGGSSQVTDSDIALMDDYIEAMDFVATAGASGVAHPELFDEDGNLINPSDQIESSADVNTLVIGEWGLSMSKEFWLGNQAIALGVTPKIMRVDIFSDTVTYGDTELDYSEDKRSHLSMNLDLGMVVPIGEHFRVALATKDLIPEEFEDANGDVIELKSRSRLGLAFVSKYVDFGIDYDLQKNDTLANELPLQEVTAGLEFKPLKMLDLRFGYRQDLEGLREDILSAGVKFQAGFFIGELAYATSDEMEGGSLQIGWAF
jgi:hypothetical protein